MAEGTCGLALMRVPGITKSCLADTRPMSLPIWAMRI